MIDIKNKLFMQKSNDKLLNFKFNYGKQFEVLWWSSFEFKKYNDNKVTHLVIISHKQIYFNILKFRNLIIYVKLLR